MKAPQLSGRVAKPDDGASVAARTGTVVVPTFGMDAAPPPCPRSLASSDARTTALCEALYLSSQRRPALVAACPPEMPVACGLGTRENAGGRGQVTERDVH